MWIARDKCGNLNIFETKPQRRSFWGKGYKKDVWSNGANGQISVSKNNKLFSNLKWEDEPIRVEVVPLNINE